jgi:dephospho-CoA kinase
MTLKIALCGKIAAGKDTVAAYLQNYRFRRYAFGDHIRALCSLLYPDRMKANAGKDRALLQGVGQDLRKYDPNIWIRLTLKELDELAPEIEADGDNICISDLRQPNELDALKAAGFYIVRVWAPDAVRLERMKARGDRFNPEDLNHETEQYVDSFEVDYEVENAGSWLATAHQVDAIVRDIKIRETEAMR